MGWPLTTEQTIAVSALFLGGVAPALIAARINRALKRDDVAAIGLNAVVTGYKTLTDQQQGRIDALRAELAEIEQNCERRLRQSEEEMNRKVGDLEKQVLHLEAEMRRRDDMWQRRVAEMAQKYGGLNE